MNRTDSDQAGLQHIGQDVGEAPALARPAKNRAEGETATARLI